MTLMLVILAVLGAGFVVVMALGRFTRPGATSIPEDDTSGSSDGSTVSDGSTGSGGPDNDDGVLARRWKRGEVPLVRGLVEPAQNLPPVLLPHEPKPDDVDRLRFSAGLRGYRMDQVDEILDILRDTLAVKDQQLAELKARLAELDASPDGSAPDRPTPDGSAPDQPSPDLPAPDRPTPDGSAPDQPSPDGPDPGGDGPDSTHRTDSDV